jgi:hypothetical protein
MTTGLDQVHLTTLQEERTTGVRLYRPHTVPKPKVSIDWGAITPSCRSCGTKTGTLNRDDQCRICAPFEPVDEPVARKRPTRRSTRRTPRQAPRVTRPARVGRPPLDLDEAAILEAYTGGQSVASIADALGCTPPPIRAVLTGAGVTIRMGNPSGGRGRGADVDEAAIVAEYKAGDTSPTIGARHGIRDKRVRAIVERHGVQLRDDRAGHSGGQNRREYDADIFAAVERLYVVEELSRNQVAEQLELSYKTVVKIMERRGVRARQHQTGRRDGAVELKSQIRALGVDATEIKAWAFRHGVTDRIKRGLPSLSVVEAYAAAHGEAGAA